MTDKQQSALKAIRSIGCSATWHIKHSSEGCEISIGGISVLLAFNKGTGLEVFYVSHEYVPFEDAILRAADAYELTCYPERGARWLPPEERKVGAT